MQRVPYAATGEDPTGRTSTARVDEGSERFLPFTRVEVDGDSDPTPSPDGEGLLLVLGGTHDLYAGSGSWIRRGLRTTPLDAKRPVAVFLPPRTRWQSQNGAGPILIVAARQPELPAVETPREELGRKPLLALAGSGKAFDPMSGTWKPSEAFLTSSEAILPRRIESIPAPAGVTHHRVLGLDYKALGLCVDEVHAETGCAVRPEPPTRGPYPSEVAIHVETEGEAQVGDAVVRAEDGPVAFRGSEVPELRAVAGRTVFVLVYAGDKGSS
ncbi:MAG: hypothetical protein O2865_16670 [Planctomycetota bacterium]|nr:hypothetical protein [Planctomycetota bacterium]MDA0933173.1 hypothetical protein [Planctomycetota bacterium]MDA1223186.1 hypothetical protein [Planctomycetota bacterium]